MRRRSWRSSPSSAPASSASAASVWPSARLSAMSRSASSLAPSRRSRPTCFDSSFTCRRVSSRREVTSRSRPSRAAASSTCTTSSGAPRRAMAARTPGRSVRSRRTSITLARVLAASPAPRAFMSADRALAVANADMNAGARGELRSPSWGGAARDRRRGLEGPGHLFVGQDVLVAPRAPRRPAPSRERPPRGAPDRPGRVLLLPAAHEALEEQERDDDPEEEAAADLHDGAGQLLVRRDADPPEPRPVVVGLVDHAVREGQPTRRDRRDHGHGEEVDHRAARAHAQLGERAAHGGPHQQGREDEHGVQAVVQEAVAAGDGVVHHRRARARP